MCWQKNIIFCLNAFLLSVQFEKLDAFDLSFSGDRNWFRDEIVEPENENGVSSRESIVRRQSNERAATQTSQIYTNNDKVLVPEFALFGNRPFLEP